MSWGDTWQKFIVELVEGPASARSFADGVISQAAAACSGVGRGLTVFCVGVTFVVLFLTDCPLLALSVSTVVSSRSILRWSKINISEHTTVEWKNSRDFEAVRCYLTSLAFEKGFT